MQRACLFHQLECGVVDCISMIHIIESQRARRVVPAPAHLSSCRATEADKADAVAVYPFVDEQQINKPRAGRSTSPEPIYYDQGPAVGQGIPGTFLSPVNIKEPSPDHVLACQREKRAADDVKELEQRPFVGIESLYKAQGAKKREDGKPAPGQSEWNKTPVLPVKNDGGIGLSTPFNGFSRNKRGGSVREHSAEPKCNRKGR